MPKCSKCIVKFYKNKGKLEKRSAWKRHDKVGANLRERVLLNVIINADRMKDMLRTMLR